MGSNQKLNQNLKLFILLIGEILELNYTLTYNELERCTNRAIQIPERPPISETFIFEKLTDISLFNELTDPIGLNSLVEEYQELGNFTNNFVLRREAIKELAHLTENPNHLHRPGIDKDFIDEFPHVKMQRDDTVLNDIEVMAGLTAHEAFFFLENEYDFNEILRHTLIYSSLLNKTDNLLEKLTLLDQNKSKLN